MNWVKVGEVTRYFGKINVAVINLDDNLMIGDWLGFVRKGELLFEQEVVSMQVEHQEIKDAAPGEEVALMVDHKVKNGTEVYRATE